MATIKKHLHSGSSVWTAYPTPGIGFQSLQADIKTDVVIIGAGITGAFMAEELSDAGFSVVVVDRREPLKGSTMATTALLQYEIDQPLSLLSKQIGFDRAARAWWRSKLSLISLADKTLILGVSRKLRDETSLYVAGNVLNAGDLSNEQDLLRQIGLQTRYMKRASLEEEYGMKASAALQSFGNYSANPYQLALGYLKKSVMAGAKIFSPVEITNIEASPRRVYLHTKSGFTLTARYAVFTTGYEVPEELRNQDYEIHSTWAFATAQQQKNMVPDMPMIWEASDPYLYIRRTYDGRIICGGEDEEFSDEEKRNAMTPKKIKKLQKKIGRLLPDIDNKAEFSWCGCFGVTPTGLPLIGPVPGLQNCFAVLAFGGNGIVNGRIGAEIIRAYLADKKDPDADIYAFKK